VRDDDRTGQSTFGTTTSTRKHLELDPTPKALSNPGPPSKRATWEDDRNVKHYRTEVVASNVEMLSGRRKKDYAAETAAQALETQAEVMGIDPADGEDFDAVAEGAPAAEADDHDDADTDDADAEAAREAVPA
jgi:hypothetical protein